MTAGLKHWRNDDLPPEIGRLLSAARNDSPRRSVIDRAVLMIGSAATVGTATTSVLGALTKVSAAGLGWTSKWGAAALLGIGLGTGAAVTARHYTVAAEQAASAPSSKTKPASSDALASRAAHTRQSAASPEPSRNLPEPNAASDRVMPRGAVQNLEQPPAVSVELQRALATKASAEIPSYPEPQEPETPGARLRVKEQAPAPIVASAMQNPQEDPQLAEEMRYLDRARGALRESRPHDALRWLEEYQRNCPAQRMLPEALLLRLRAEMRAGNRAAATAAAREISLRFPESPHAARAREMIATEHFE